MRIKSMMLGSVYLLLAETSLAETSVIQDMRRGTVALLQVGV